ncbi:Pentalenene oxygenase [Rubripirellula obstinata]|uniref:Pentalenene oxygenase n=1 Tax=Rubripirellula obstinata TaxID=406547 RepID=A0A5B1CL07_9BACT|nr:cytochrome P450 [Rubripirellula obstinata]KAA1260073.1 Pentalenene oxygenase [Rubripirellula obstinata]
MVDRQNSVNSNSFDGQLVRAPWMYRQWMLAGNPAYFFDRLVNDFGDFVHCRGLFDFYLVNHPSLVKQVLQDTHTSFDKNSLIYDRFRVAFGGGLVVAEGQPWKRRRKSMQPSFGPTTIQHFFDLMVHATDRMTDQWDQDYQEAVAFDIAKEMNKLTLQIAGRALFSNGFDSASERISHWTQIINHYVAKPPLPIIRSSWFPSRTNFRFFRALDEFHTFLKQMISDRQDAAGHHDLLSMLMAAGNLGSDDDPPMTDLEIVEETLGMIIGGHETSSSALTWIWYELQQNPAIQQRLHDELDQVIGNREIQLSDLPKLKFVRMIIEEALRLHPPFWFENRNAMTDVTLGGATLPMGSMVVFSRYSLHRHEQFWENPDSFNPNRFDPENMENNRSTYATVPFGGGPRICIGIHFAMMELTVAVSSIAKRFEVIIDESNRHRMAAHLTMTPKHGLRVRLKRR